MLASLEFCNIVSSCFLGLHFPLFLLSLSLPRLPSCSLTAGYWPFIGCLHLPFSLHHSPNADGFASWLADLSLYSACTPPMFVCSPRRILSVPASLASTLPSYSTSLLCCLLPSYSLTADCWPISRCPCPPFSLHCCSVCYWFHVLVDSFDPCSFLFS